MNTKTATINKAQVATIAIVMLAVAVTIAAFIATSTASASATYSSELGAATPTAVKVAAGDAAGYTAIQTAKARAAAATKSAKRKAAAKHRRVRRTAAVSKGSELAQAQALLNSLIAKHPILAGTTVEIGDAHGYQAISYYSSGRIIVSPTHTASLERIMNHEVWHVIDFRDNGVIDWGENVPR